jgi:hypothetical protein
LIGKQRVVKESVSVSEPDEWGEDPDISRSYRETDEYPVTTQQLNEMDTGEAIVIGQTGWSHTKIAEATPQKFRQLREAAARAREGGS